MTEPNPREAGLCWAAGCPRRGAKVDMSELSGSERVRVKGRVGHPLACPEHRKVVEAKLAYHIARRRTDVARERFETAMHQVAA